MDILGLLDGIRTIARNGLHYAENPYDRERYQQLLQLAAGSYGSLTGESVEHLSDQLLREMGHVTPKVGTDAAIFDHEGKILLMDRSDGTGWCLPCGWVEPNEKPAEAAVREAREETGLDVRIVRLVGVFTRRPGVDTGPFTAVAIVHLCERTGGKLTLSHEGHALEYWSIDQVPTWHGTHERFARIAYDMWRSDRPLPAISD